MLPGTRGRQGRAGASKFLLRFLLRRNGFGLRCVWKPEARVRAEVLR
jgi:hypothetical protein